MSVRTGSGVAPLPPGPEDDPDRHAEATINDKVQAKVASESRRAVALLFMRAGGCTKRASLPEPLRRPDSSLYRVAEAKILRRL